MNEKLKARIESMLTPEKNKRLAELCGLWLEEILGRPSYIYPRRYKHKYIPESHWSPGENIEQAMMVEEAIPNDKRQEYMGRLFAIVTNGETWTELNWWDAIHATAEQRCRAALAALEAK